MDKIKAQQLNNLGDQLTATRDEIYQMGHQFEELIVQVSKDSHFYILTFILVKTFLMTF